MDFLIEVKNIKKRFGKRTVLSDVSFGLKKGEILGLIGRSGCGKSTLLKILIGMVNVNSGKIFFEEMNALRKMNTLRENTGFATQENMLFEELTVKENSFYFGRLYGLRRREIKERFAELMSLLGLSGFEHVEVGKLSGGMQKRANILVSLIHYPKLLILDEPTAGLDPLLRENLWKYIHKVNQDGTTILVTSHLLEEIETNCNRIAILNNGEINSVASVEEYKKKYGSEKTLMEIFNEVLKK